MPPFTYLSVHTHCYPQPLMFPFACWGLFKSFVRGVVKGTLTNAVTLNVVLIKPQSTGSVIIVGPNPAYVQRY